LISKRIKAIVSFIDIDDLIVDVGCDHAYVSKLLAKRGQKSIASDIVEGIIEKRNYSKIHSERRRRIRRLR